MRIRGAVIAGLLALTVGLTGCGKSEAEQQADFQKALSSSATKTNRPEACKSLRQEDYDTLLTAWVLKHAIDDMPKKDQDTLDYYDDGEINGSVG
ncbi:MULTISPECIES: hypothetical protein [unclassified Streptomyces]|uniref:hypothetical protein n=1 Tax=unclassified Streptomyces TaxID=2593676 RepID=UPI00224E995A|nr:MULTISPECIES: hypothetical protein [unclassified Streptomyces]MCX4649355.1 hypothetical protein [Streptomyces sp. NBC_01446]MCX5321447.1 hypothetical protein [Streptomyces sp. NBC_00120]